MLKKEIIPAIIREHKAVKSAQFPDHVVAQTAMIGQEFGTLQAVAIAYKYSNLKDPLLIAMQQTEIEQAAIKTAAACIRFLEQFNS